MIGILAGMGPMSTAPFIELLMKGWQQTFDAVNDIEFPHVVVYSLPTPFYVDREINHAEMEKTIKEGLLKLQSWGAKLIAMPCNTAHVYFDRLQQSLEIKLLNIVKETVVQIPVVAKNVSLLATQTTFDSELYQHEIRQSAKTFIFETNWQTQTNALILAVKANLGGACNIAYDLLTCLSWAKVDTLIIGCTDISEIIYQVQRDYDIPIKIIDSSKALVSAIIRENTNKA